MTTAQSSFTFAQELKHMGVVIPSSTISIKISCDRYDDPLIIAFKLLDLNSNKVRWAKHVCTDEYGSNISVRVFKDSLKEFVQFDELTEKFEIIADMDDVVKLVVYSALPEGSFKNIKHI